MARDGVARASTELSFDKIRFKQWELAVDSIGELLVLVDGHGRAVRANRTIERWHLAAVVDVAGMDVHQLLHGDCDDASCYLRRLCSRMVADQGTDRRFETELEDPRLGRWIHLTLERLADNAWSSELPAVASPRFLLAVRDITRIHRQRIREGRRARFEALHFFARSLAHEIGNPLAAMLTTAEVLAVNINRFESAKVDAYLHRILDGAERLKAIVDRTLREHHFTELTLEPVAVDLLFNRMHRLFADDMTIHGLQFGLVRSSSPQLHLCADLTAVEEVLTNVLRNALEATPAGGSVFIGCRREAQRVLVTVRDTGVGMSELQVDNLFQPFFTTKPEGLGIGLAYSSYLMSKMDGSIKVDSQIGHGTIVRLDFPRAAPAS